MMRVPRTGREGVGPKRWERPAGGYGTSSLFRRGNPGHEALRRAHEDRLCGIVPSSTALPGFDASMEAIQGLDAPDG